MSEIPSLLSRKSWAAKRKTINSQPIKLLQEELVEVSCLTSNATLPLVIESRLPGLDLPTWVAANLDYIESLLLKHGGLLFRGFGIENKSAFRSFLNSTSVELMNYLEGATPRTELGDGIYTSTEFPPDQTIALHNELSYVNTFPMKIWFCCIEPARERGETPIADMRRVLQRINPTIRKRFLDKGWMLVRNFGDGFSLSWEKAFHANCRDQVEEYCRHAAIDFEWKSDNRLRTRQVRSPIAVHPVTAEPIWFNHISFWHVSSLTPALGQMLLAEFQPQDLPYNTYYGDGAEIEDSVIEEIREAYLQETVRFAWQRGDVLMLDNMLTAHGRNPYRGPRRILTAMGQPQSRALV